MDNDFVICQLCGFKSKNLTTHIIAHGYSTKEYKIKFNVKYVQSQSLINIHKENIRNKNPTKGRVRTEQEIINIRNAKIGKGLGKNGKYTRTKEIREKISNSVSKLHLNGHYDNVKPGKHKHVFSIKANQTILTRSSWEFRFVKAVDKHPAITDLIYEPFTIKYIFDGIQRNYIPDYLITYDDVIQALVEVKRDDYLENDPKTQEKTFALENYAYNNGYNVFIINYESLVNLEQEVACYEKKGLNDAEYYNTYELSRM